MPQYNFRPATNPISAQINSKKQEKDDSRDPRWMKLYEHHSERERILEEKREEIRIKKERIES
jgi:hypothetical protein